MTRAAPAPCSAEGPRPQLGSAPRADIIAVYREQADREAMFHARWVFRTAAGGAGTPRHAGGRHAFRRARRTTAIEKTLRKHWADARDQFRQRAISHDELCSLLQRRAPAARCGSTGTPHDQERRRHRRHLRRAFGMKATHFDHHHRTEPPTWARHAAVAATGFATSVIACGCEAGIERERPPAETPDGRPGVAVLIFAMSGKELAKQIERRVGQCVLTCPTTAVYAGIDEASRWRWQEPALLRRRLADQQGRRQALLARAGDGRRVLAQETTAVVGRGRRQPVAAGARHRPR